MACQFDGNLEGVSEISCEGLPFDLRRIRMARRKAEAQDLNLTGSGMTLNAQTIFRTDRLPPTHVRMP